MLHEVIPAWHGEDHVPMQTPLQVQTMILVLQKQVQVSPLQADPPTSHATVALTIAAEYSENVTFHYRFSFSK